MKTLLLAFACLLSAPMVTFAEEAPAKTGAFKDARIVPVMKNGVFVGIKVFAIRAGGRFDQPTAKFEAGDQIEQIDGVSIATDAGGKLLHDTVVLGKADATVTVRRKDQLVMLASKKI